MNTSLILSNIEKMQNKPKTICHSNGIIASNYCTIVIMIQMQPSSVAACRWVEHLSTQQVRQGLSHEYDVTSGTLFYIPPLLAQCVSYFSFLQCSISSCCLLTQHMCLPSDSRTASASFDELGKHPNFCKLIFTCSFSVLACYFSLGFSETTGFFSLQKSGPSGLLSCLLLCPS